MLAWNVLGGKSPDCRDQSLFVFPPRASGQLFQNGSLGGPPWEGPWVKTSSPKFVHQNAQLWNGSSPPFFLLGSRPIKICRSFWVGLQGTPGKAPTFAKTLRNRQRAARERLLREILWSRVAYFFVTAAEAQTWASPSQAGWFGAGPPPSATTSWSLQSLWFSSPSWWPRWWTAHLPLLVSCVTKCPCQPLSYKQTLA